MRFLGGPWHGKDHDIPDGLQHWQVPTIVTVQGLAGTYGFQQIEDMYLYRRLRLGSGREFMVPVNITGEDLADLLEEVDSSW